MTNEISSSMTSLAEKTEPSLPAIRPIDTIAGILEDCHCRVALLNTDYARQLEEDLLTRIKAHNIKLLSYNVADTLLLKNNKPIAVRWFELADRISNKIREIEGQSDAAPTTDDVFCARIASFRIFEATSTNTEIQQTSEDVAKFQCNFLGIDESFEEVFRDEEILYETSNVDLNRPLLNVANGFVESGGQLLLLDTSCSTTHWLDQILKETITSNGCQEMDSCPTSLKFDSDDEASFEQLADEHEVSRNQCFHIGSDWSSDYARPKSSGWHSQYFPISRTEAFQRAQQQLEFTETCIEREIRLPKQLREAGEHVAKPTS